MILGQGRHTGKVSPLWGTPECCSPPTLCGNTNGELSLSATGFGACGRGLNSVSHSDSAGTTHFICLTMVLFPDSPAPAEK